MWQFFCVLLLVIMNFYIAIRVVMIQIYFSNSSSFSFLLLETATFSMKLTYLPVRTSNMQPKETKSDQIFKGQNIEKNISIIF